MGVGEEIEGADVRWGKGGVRWIGNGKKEKSVGVDGGWMKKNGGAK